LKRTLIAIFIIVVVSGVFYYLKFYYQKEKVDIWDLVPKNTLAVYETTQPIKIWNDLISMPVWENLSSIPEINDLNSRMILLDSITGKKGNLERLFRDRELLISMHKISNTDIGMLFYLSLNSSAKRNIFNMIIDHYNNQDDLAHDVRVYEAYTIHELSFKDEESVFSFIEYKNHFVGSFTPVLIDDVIRNISNSFQTNFQTLAPKIFDLQPIEMDHGNLYINFSRIPELIRNFSAADQEYTYTNYLKWFSGATYYDISFEDNRIFFNGSVEIPVDDHEYFLSTFYNQTPQPIESIFMMPDRTASYLSYTYDNFPSWRKEVDEFWEVNFPETMNRKIRFLNDNNIYEKDLYGWIGNEVGIATLQSIDIQHPDMIMMIKATDIKEGLRLMDDLTMYINHQNEDTLLYEDYSENSIHQLSISEFPASIMGDEFLGFEKSYYTSIGNFLVIGNSFEVVKQLLNDLANENTWGKSLRFMQYFDNAQKNANVSYFVNFSNSWNSFYGSLNTTWKDYFKKFDHQFKHFELLSFQISNINNNYYTSAAIQHRQQTSVITTPSEFFKEQMVITEYPIVTKPFIFRSHLDRSLEVMLQDSSNQVYFISKDGKVLWKKEIDERIKGDIYQVDFYLNNKLQYLFATNSKIYILDRNGRNISGFPIELNQQLEVDFLNLIDYDNSKRYRYLITDKLGDIYLFNKNGKHLEGWNPRKLKGRFSSVPFHLRISGRDGMMAIQKNGLINMMNRKGNMYSGFPVKLEFDVNGPVFIQRGIDFDRSLVHVVLETGELYKINLNGAVQEKIQLNKPDKESNYRIVADNKNENYVICRQDYNSINVMDPNGEIIFKKSILVPGELEVQYYNFSAGNELFAFTDKQQEFTYLIDRNGGMVNMQPVESGYKIGLLFSEVNNKYNLYSCYGNQFTVSSFYKK